MILYDQIKTSDYSDFFYTTILVSIQTVEVYEFTLGKSTELQFQPFYDFDMV